MLSHSSMPTFYVSILCFKYVLSTFQRMVCQHVLNAIVNSVQFEIQSQMLGLVAYINGTFPTFTVKCLVAQLVECLG